MRGDRVAQRGRRKLPLGRQAGAPFFYFYKERLGTGSPLIRPSVRTGAPSPKGKALGVGAALSDYKPTPPARPAGGGPLRA